MISIPAGESGSVVYVFVLPDRRTTPAKIWLDQATAECRYVHPREANRVATRVYGPVGAPRASLTGAAAVVPSGLRNLLNFSDAVAPIGAIVWV